MLFLLTPFKIFFFVPGFLQLEYNIPKCFLLVCFYLVEGMAFILLDVLWDSWICDLTPTGRRVWQPTSVFLPGESLWTKEPGGLHPMRSQRVRHDYVTKHSTHQLWKVLRQHYFMNIICYILSSFSLFQLHICFLFTSQFGKFLLTNFQVQ